MASPLRPTPTKTYGRKNWVLVPAFADTDAPKVSEMTAVGALDVTDVLFVDGTGRPTQETNRVQRPRRVGDTRTHEQIGDTNVTGGDMVYALNPQGADGSDGRKMYELIPEFTTMFLVERKGVAKETDFAVGQVITIYPVEFGPSEDTEVGEGETAEAAGKCAFAVTDDPARLKTLVA